MITTIAINVICILLGFMLGVYFGINSERKEQKQRRSLTTAEQRRRSRRG